ncbi:MAG: methyltransferase domain-containing protein [Armatimonadetes bacterium]|jgi:2-polyprenyl-6-hydroxyphenyl methylase/3-demethylubiquinone-9 3-methyltransferase|nr:methyltransferase domain-containing protein [Armatimonadota bacterium]MDI9586520.1 class I SAM-dependent methyltransferase [Acidobacteriota bacterium]
MKDAREIVPLNPEHARLRDFDLREINAQDPGDHMALKYMARLEGVVAAVRKHAAPGGLVLEAGCAQANAGLLLAEEGYRCVGLDLLPDSLGYARLKQERGEFHPVCGDATNLPFAQATFDAALVGELLEHCARPAQVLGRIAQCVRPGGCVIVTTPNGQRIGNQDRTFASACAEEDEMRQFGPGGEDHLFEFTLGELAGVVRDAGLEVISTRRLGSALHSNRLRALRKGLSPRAVQRVAELLNAAPVLGPKLALTLLVVARVH